MNLQPALSGFTVTDRYELWFPSWLHVDSKDLAEHLLREVHSASEDNLHFLNNYMRTCSGSIGQLRRSCPSAGLVAKDSCLICNEGVGLLRGIVVPLSLVDAGRAEAITSELAGRIAAWLLCAASDHCKRPNFHTTCRSAAGAAMVAGVIT